MLSEHLNHAVSDDNVGCGTLPDPRVEHHLQSLLDWLQSDLLELASLLGVADKNWFVSVVEELFDTALQSDES